MVGPDMQVWPLVTRALSAHNIACVLDLIEGRFVREHWYLNSSSVTRYFDDESDKRFCIYFGF